MLLQHYFATHKNLGDILYYFLVKNFFCEKERIVHNGACSINRTNLPFFDYIQATNIKRALRNTQANSHLMIGGGAIIRKNSLSSFRTSSINFSTAEQFLTSRLPSRYISTILESAYSSLRLPPRTIGPFLLDLGSKKSYGYVSVGFAGTMNQLNAVQLNSVFGNAKYVYVRDRIAYQYLHNNNVRSNLLYAPDLAVLTDIIFSREFLEPHYLSFKTKVNLSKKNYVIIQSNSNRVNYLLEDVGKVSYIAKDLDAQVIPLALAEVHGDGEYAARLSMILGSHYRSDLTFFERIAAIAHATFFIGTSMHGCLLSFVYGHRFLPLDPSSIKLSQLIATLAENHPHSKKIADSFSYPTAIAYNSAMYDDLLQCKHDATANVLYLVERIKNIITD